MQVELKKNTAFTANMIQLSCIYGALRVGLSFM